MEKTIMSICKELEDYEIITKKYIVLFLLIALFILSPLLAGLPFWRWQIEAGNFMNIIANQWWFWVITIIVVKRDIEEGRQF